MNLDPQKFCTHCQRPRPRKTFRRPPGAGNNRMCCEECYEKIIAGRKSAKKRALTAR
jgi:hypothetical protein